MNSIVERIRKRVKKSDLVGRISGFPLEVVQKMCEYQVEQGNQFNINTFQRREDSAAEYGGFTWSDTKEGQNFWAEVIKGRNFNLFFEKFNK